MKIISPRIVGYRLGTVNEPYYVFKPVISYRKPHTYSTCIGEANENEIHSLS